MAALLILAPAAHAQGPLLIREVISREVGINVGSVQTPEIKEVVSREVSFFMVDPDNQVISREYSLCMVSPTSPPALTDTEVNVTASPRGDTATLDWSSYNHWAVRDVSHYAIYYSASPIYDVTGMTPYAIVPGETLTATFTGLPEWQDHYFAVVPVDGLGSFDPVVIYSAAYVLFPQMISREVGLFVGHGPDNQVISREVSLNVVDTNAPPRLGDEQLVVSVSPRGDTATLDWSSYNHWAVRDVDHYAIYFSSAPIYNVSNLTPYAVFPSETFSATFTGLPEWQDHYFAVVPVDGLGNFDPVVIYSAAYVLFPQMISREVGMFVGHGPDNQLISREYSFVRAGTNTPAAITYEGSPFGPTASSNAYGAVNLDWNFYNSWAERDIVRYRIYVSTNFFDDVTGMTPVAYSVDGLQTATLEGLECEQIYYTAVVAESAAGYYNPLVYPRSSKASVCELGEVSNVVAQVTRTTIRTTWDLGGVGTDLGHFIQKFHIYFDGAPVPLVLGQTVREWTASGLQPGTTHQIRVHTVDIFGTESAGVTIFATTTPLPSGVTRVINGPIPAAAIKTNNYTTVTVMPNNTIVGDAGIIIGQLGPEEVPTKLFIVLAGRTNTVGAIHWDTFMDSFELNFYAGTNSFVAGTPPFATLLLSHPVDSNNVAVTTITNGASTIPNLPIFEYVITNDLPLVNSGYLMGFNLTTNPLEADAETTLLPLSVLEQLRTNSFTMSCWVRSDLNTYGGVRVCIQRTGYGQYLPLMPTVRHNGVFRFYPSNFSNFSYALGLEITGPTDPPFLARSPASLAATAAAGMVTNRSFSVWNAGGGLLAYTVSTNAGWLALDSAAGTSAGEVDTVQVTLSAADLGVGVHEGLIVIDAPGASNTPQHVAVTFTVTEGGAPTTSSTTTTSTTTVSSSTESSTTTTTSSTTSTVTSPSTTTTAPPSGPLMRVLGINGTTIENGDVTPSLADGSDFGTVPAWLKAESTFVVTNAGAASLQVTKVERIGGDFSYPRVVTVHPPWTIAPGASFPFTVRFRGSRTGLITGGIVLHNSDTNSSRYGFRVQGVGSTPHTDTDHDGWSDLQEWLAGTDPNDPTSVIKPLLLLPTTNPLTAVLSIGGTATNRVYDIISSTNLIESAWSGSGQACLGTGSNLVFILTNDLPRRFDTFTADEP